MRDDLYQTMASVEDRFWWFVAKRRIVRALIERYAPSPTAGERPRLLDIGCGTGGLLRDMAPAFDVEGVDSSELARAACAERGFEARHCWLPDDLPADDGAFDVAVMSDVLEHVEDDAGSVRAAASRLRPGGILVCTVPAHMWLWTERDRAHQHFRRYDRRGYESIFEHGGLEPEMVSWYMTHLMPVLVAQRAAARLMGDRAGGEGSGDLRIPPAPVNAALRLAFASERFWLGRVPAPFGASLVSVHRRVAGAGP